MIPLAQILKSGMEKLKDPPFHKVQKSQNLGHNPKVTLCIFLEKQQAMFFLTYNLHTKRQISKHNLYIIQDITNFNLLQFDLKMTFRSYLYH